MLGHDHAIGGACVGALAVNAMGTAGQFASRLAGMPVPLGAVYLAPHLTVQHMVVSVVATSAAGVLGMAVGAVAALAPDLDSPSSTLGALLPAWWHALTPGHRGVTHSLAFTALWGLVLQLLAFLLTVGSVNETVPILFVLGYLSHLAADSVTDHGVPLLWVPPFLQFTRPVWALAHWHFKTPLTFATGSGWEVLVTGVFSVVSLGYVLHAMVVIRALAEFVHAR